MAQALKVKLEFFFQFVTGVIGAYCDSHKRILPWKTLVVARKLMLKNSAAAVHEFSPGTAHPEAEIVPNYRTQLMLEALL
jgi:hypothetical protein